MAYDIFILKLCLCAPCLFSSMVDIVSFCFTALCDHRMPMQGDMKTVFFYLAAH